MSSLHLAFKNIITRPLQSALIMFALASGVALLITTFLLSSAVENGLQRNAKNIDLVVGAKGSPLQLVLSSVYHADIPSANVDSAEIEAIQHNPRVKSSTPIIMGDNYRGFRIVGTTPGYLDLYDAKLDRGALWHDDHQAIAGALTGLKIGAKFASTHGFAADGGDVHADHPYTVTGVLKPTGTIIDRLIVTSVESVNEAHHHEGGEEVHHEKEHHDAHEHEEHGHEAHEKDHHEEHQAITALLIQTRSPVDIMNLPRQINQSTSLMAGSPSYEIARLAKSFGLGRDLVLFIGGVFIILSFFVMLSSLMIGLRGRQYDLAVLRVLGASQSVIFASVLFEAAILGALGSLLGIVAGHGLAYYASMSIAPLSVFVLPSSMLTIGVMDGLVLAAGILTAALAAFLPALRASHDDIASVLARGQA